MPNGPRSRTPSPSTTPFFRAVVRVVKRIPEGKVATYGQVARLAKKPGAARAVGWILNSSARAYNLPWHRVLNRAGKISFHEDSREFRRQQRGLLLEGVAVSRRGEVDLATVLWDGKTTRKKREPKS